jgi:hypothetical protein
MLDSVVCIFLWLVTLVLIELRQLVFEAVFTFVSAYFITQWQHNQKENLRIFSRDLTLILEHLDLTKNSLFTLIPIKWAKLGCLPVKHHDCDSRFKYGDWVKESFLNVSKLVQVCMFLKHSGVHTIKLLLVELWHFDMPIRVIFRLILMHEFIAVQFKVIFGVLGKIV